MADITLIKGKEVVIPVKHPNGELGVLVVLGPDTPWFPPVDTATRISEARASYAKAIGNARSNQENFELLLCTVEGLDGIGFKAAKINKEEFLKLAEKGDSINGNKKVTDLFIFWRAMAKAEAADGEDNTGSISRARAAIEFTDYAKFPGLRAEDERSWSELSGEPFTSLRRAGSGTPVRSRDEIPVPKA